MLLRRMAIVLRPREKESNKPTGKERMISCSIYLLDLVSYSTTPVSLYMYRARVFLIIVRGLGPSLSSAM